MKKSSLYSESNIPVSASKNKETISHRSTLNGVNPSAPFYLKGSNPSRNIIGVIFFFIGIVYTFDQTCFPKICTSSGFSCLQLILFFISLLCWFYLNWKSSNRKSNINIFFKYCLKQLITKSNFDKETAGIGKVATFISIYITFPITYKKILVIQIIYTSLEYIL
ncbi:hypothetical protein MXB_4042, partial [Myxobolus squamalis]